MLVSSKLIDRSQQREIVERILDCETKCPKPSLVEFYGVAGIGKSKVLEYVKIKSRDCNIPFLSIDFLLTEATESSTRIKLGILQQACTQLEHYVSPSHAYFLSEARALIGTAFRRSEKSQEESESGLLKQCCTLTAKAIVNSPLVIMFDSLERCADEVFRWLWDEFLVAFERRECGDSGTTNQKDGQNAVVTFVAGRGQFFRNNWKPSKLSTNREIASYPLDPLEFNDTKLQIQDLAPEFVSETNVATIHQISNGHPLSTRNLVELLLGMKHSEKSLNKKELAEEVYHRVISEYVLFGVDEHSQRLIHLACVPRRFDAGMLLSLDQYIYPKSPVDQPIQWYQAVLTSLCGPPSHAVQLGSHSPAYELENTLRRILHSVSTVINSVEVKTIHERVYELVDEEVKRPSPSSVPPAHRIVELLYHKAIVLQLQGESIDSLQDTLRKLLDSHYRTNTPKIISELLTLGELIDQDSELAEIIGADEQRRLSSIAKHLADSLASPTPSTNIVYLNIDFQQPNEYKISWNHAGQSLITTEIALSGRQFSIQDWRANPEKIGKLAYRVFLPERAQEFLRNKSDCQLQLTTSAPDVPWELLHDGESFLSIKWPVARRANILLEPKALHNDNRGGLRALVIGNPTDDLDGAAEEARQVTDRLNSQGIEVECLIGSSEVNALGFLERMTEQPYDLVHYAGHAHFDPQDPRRSGMSFSDGPLYAEELERAITSNAFVFLSACDGTMSKTYSISQGYRGNMVDGLALSILHCGCVGCLGPMWPIDDRYAVNFALEFYDHLLNSESVSFSEAVRHARIKLQKGSYDFWNAWIFYGDTSARLRKPMPFN